MPWNGLRVASTFSGCGGSCLGYRMAGFRVVWANEFVPAAQESYLANADPGSVLDKHDIRTVKPEEILEAAGLKKGELDLFDGSPPCQAFSTAGKRERGWGSEKRYEHGATQKNETLFTEYIRLLRGLEPLAFIAENVSGLVKGAAKGFFLEILRDLKASGYRVEARLLDAQWLGVPQRRQRVIFVGVRSDLGLAPTFPDPLPYRYSVRDACPWIGVDAEVIAGNEAFEPKWAGAGPSPAILAGGPHGGSGEVRERAIYRLGGYGGYDTTDTPSPAVLATQCRIDVERGQARRKFTIAELRRICSFPDDFILTGSYAQQWARLGNSVPPLMMRAIAAAVRDRVLISARGLQPWTGDSAVVG